MGLRRCDRDKRIRLGLPLVWMGSSSFERQPTTQICEKDCGCDTFCKFSLVSGWYDPEPFRVSLTVASESGILFSHGNNKYGGVKGGASVLESVSEPAAAFEQSFRSVSISSTHSLALSSGGAVLFWGSNGFGAGCSGSRSWLDVSTVPRQIDTTHILQGRSVVQVLSTERSSLLLLSDGAVYGCGVNDGPLGLAAEIDFALLNLTLIVPVSVFGGFVSLSAGSSHVLALTGNGTAIAWGDNTFGQLGIGLRNERVTRRPSLISKLANATVTRLFASGASSAALANNSLFLWGSNAQGRLGLGSLNATVSQPVQLILPPTLVPKGVSFSNDDVTSFFYFSNAQSQQAIYAAGSNERQGLFSRAFSSARASEPVLCDWIQDEMSKIAEPIVKMVSSAGYGVFLTRSGDLYSFVAPMSELLRTNPFLTLRPQSSVVPLPLSVGDSTSFSVYSKHHTILALSTVPGDSRSCQL